MRDGQRFTHRHDAVGQADLHRLVCVNGPASEDQVHGPRVTDHPRKPNRPAIDQRHAPATAEDAEDRVLLDHPQVGKQRQLQATGHRVTGDRRDKRLGQGHATRAHRSGAVRVNLRPTRLVGDRRQVGTRTKRAASAVQDRHSECVVGLELFEGCQQLRGHRAVHRVASVRRIQRDRADVVVDVVLDLLRHAVTLSSH